MRWFKAARQAAPNAKLFWNENCILADAVQAALKRPHTLRWLNYLKEQGAPIDGLGMQSHMGMTATPPRELLSLLDKFGSLDVELVASEFDVHIQNANDPEQIAFQQDYMRDFMTALFSHPSVTGIVHWTPFHPKKQKKTGTLFRTDGGVYPAGETWIDMVANQWWTDETLKTRSDGEAAVRGFLGDYQITATVGNDSKTVDAKLTQQGNTVTIQMP